MTTVHKNQCLLIIVPAHEELAPSIIGAFVQGIDEQEFNNDTFLLDAEPGIYVWTGTITEGGLASYDGELSPATIGDLERFGMRGLLPVQPASAQ